MAVSQASEICRRHWGSNPPPLELSPVICPTFQEKGPLEFYSTRLREKKCSRSEKDTEKEGRQGNKMPNLQM